MRDDCHVLLVIFPGQGQINPSLQFAKRLVNLGVKVTLSTSLYVINRISKRPAILPGGIDFVPFSHGYDDGYKGTADGFCHLYDSVKTKGSEYVANLVKAKATEGAPFTQIIFTTLMAWVGEVARNLQVPATLLWIQPAAVLDIYYSYFTDSQDLFKSCGENGVVQIPGLPALGTTDFPSYMFSNTTTNALDWAIQGMKDQIDLINSEENPKILVNTFDDLEVDALRAIKKLTLIGIGPLVPSAYLDGKDPSDTSFGGDLLEKSDDYIEWLDSQPKGSVVYVAFGSYADLPTAMMEEIAQGLLQSKMPFLWVIRETLTGVQKPEENLSCKEELEKQGKIVRWCTQVEVLQHPAIGCFLTHCGWNSTIESLVLGMPIVAFPLWSDQICNAKLIQDVWKTGTRVKANEDGIVEARELKRCIECVMEEGGAELRKNAMKWRELAKSSMKEYGSSNLNLKTFVNDVLFN
ncbi:PREDICTED: crocetin glucosyltransferase, chloroplastic-like [Ipomoea nil]|uniref:crocetin glucosyltransferase, chloroplastic-like n=1 Tax=Ipomoea nil TaxID=35883 RepID=UPI000900949A|nr:PREDICTED: crocetin glucosyltransferase, chloroplastic-like [Ipomoea nil]